MLKDFLIYIIQNTYDLYKQKLKDKSMVVVDDVARIQKNSLITVFYNDVGESVKFKKGFFQEFTNSFIILKCDDIVVRIPRYKIIRIEEKI